MSDYKLKIVHLFPDFLNLYGDKGNIEAMRKRLEWRDVEAEVCFCTEGNEEIDFENTDIFVLGGGSDREQETVRQKLMEKKDAFKDYAEKGGVILAICGGFELLGNTIRKGEEETECLGILDIETDIAEDGKRFTGNIIIENSELGKIVGFENHSGRMNIKDNTPLGKVITGKGNDGKSGAEGVIYKNVFGTYLHGPLLPKNPNLCDYILNRALKRKYEDFMGLMPLGDRLEDKARRYIIKRFLG
ncbi:MAG: glutamine amidotransferase [Clostridia bacterium]|nr:glutamine amidotransferase [Clostridia bacterium]